MLCPSTQAITHISAPCRILVRGRRQRGLLEAWLCDKGALLEEYEIWRNLGLKPAS